MSNEAATRRRVALVPQDHRLLPWRTAIGNVEVPLLAGKLPRAQRRNRAYEALRQVQAAHFASEPVCKLSGGMQRRVVIARALAVNPEVLLLDEPFSAVDWWTRRGLHEELATLVATGDLGAVLVTHDLDEAVRLADEVLVLVGYPARVGAALPVDVARDERDSPEGAHSLIAVRAAALRAMQLGAPVKATEISSNQT
jgi:NitT/TauT family transport system ATP-binding protein